MSDSADRNYRYSEEEAKRLTGIDHVTVSRWRKQLKNPEKYRKRMIVAACRAAGVTDEAMRDELMAAGEWHLCANGGVI